MILRAGLYPNPGTLRLLYEPVGERESASAKMAEDEGTGTLLPRRRRELWAMTSPVARAPPATRGARPPAEHTSSTPQRIATRPRAGLSLGPPDASAQAGGAALRAELPEPHAPRAVAQDQPTPAAADGIREVHEPCRCRTGPRTQEAFLEVTVPRATQESAARKRRRTGVRRV